LLEAQIQGILDGHDSVVGTGAPTKSVFPSPPIDRFAGGTCTGCCSCSPPNQVASRQPAGANAQRVKRPTLQLDPAALSVIAVIPDRALKPTGTPDAASLTEPASFFNELTKLLLGFCLFPRYMPQRR
jgi:hypothetical protein